MMVLAALSLPLLKGREAKVAFDGEESQKFLENGT